jgi:hypothetical protein
MPDKQNHYSIPLSIGSLHVLCRSEAGEPSDSPGMNLTDLGICQKYPVSEQDTCRRASYN